MTTVSFTDEDNTSIDICLRQYVSARPLSAGQTFTGGQAAKGQIRCIEVAVTGNMRWTVGIQIIASDGSTIQKSAKAPSAGVSAEFDAVTLTNRIWSTTTATGNYTTVAGDYLVIEIGVRGVPTAGGHDSSLRLGDAAASDLPEDDTGTTDLRPWIELADTLLFVPPLSWGILIG
jgi:hypothetical protein